MKILVRLSIIFVILLAGLFFVAQFMVNRPFVREKVTTILSEKLGRKISLSGLSVSVVPSIGLNLKDLMIYEENSENVFASLAGLQVRAKLFPLLSKKVIIQAIILNHPKLNVIEKSEGTYNFSSLMKVSSPGATSEQKEEEQVPEETQTSKPDVSIDLIQIKNAELTSEKKQASGEAIVFRLHDVNLNIRDFSLVKGCSIDLSGKIGEKSEFSFKGKVGSLGNLATLEAELDTSLEHFSAKDLNGIVAADTWQNGSFEELNFDGHVQGKTDVLTAKGKLTFQLMPSGKNLSLKGELNWKKPSQFILNELNLQLGNSDLLLTGEFSNGEAPQFKFNLASEKLDLDDFMLVSSQTSEKVSKTPVKAESSTSTSSSGARSSASENPLANNQSFQKAQGTFEANLKNVTAKKNVLTDVTLKALLEKGVLSFEKFSLNTSDGSMEGSGRVNLQNPKLQYDFDSRLQGLKLEKLSVANLGEEKIRGVLTGQAQIQGAGFERRDLEKALSGKANLEVKEGELVGKNLKSEVLLKLNNPLLASVLPGLAQMQEEAKTQENVTPFKDFVVDLSIGRGRINLEKVNLTSEDFQFRGKGSVDFALQSNIQTQVVFSKEFTEKMLQGKKSSVLPMEDEGLLIPVQITGPLDKPVVLPDIAALVSSLAKGQLGDKLGSLLGQKKEGGQEGEERSNPLSQLLGGGKSSSTESSNAEPAGTSSQNNPLKGLFGGESKSNAGDGESKKSPFNLF